MAPRYVLDSSYQSSLSRVTAYLSILVGLLSLIYHYSVTAHTGGRSVSNNFLYANTPTIMAGVAKMSFLGAAKNRRSIYALQNTSSIPDSELVSLAEQCLLEVPSAFNSQTTRIAILLHDNHRKLWEIAGSTLLAKIGDERYNAGTKAKIEGFKAAYGSVLFWDDPPYVDSLRQAGGAMHGPKAEEWTHQGNGMHQFFMWTAIESFGMGANLQHYNPLIDDEVKKTWGLPEQWVLKAQLVFGEKNGEITLQDRAQKVKMEDRLKVFGVES